MKRRTWKAAALLAGVGCVMMLGALPLRAGTAATQENEEDGVTVPQGHKEAYEAAKEQMKEAPQEKHSSGSWFLAGAAGMGWAQFDNGSFGNSSLSGSQNETFTGGVDFGYYWHDPDKWGNLSFTAESIGLYTGSTTSLGGAGSGATIGLLGLGGTLGYRIAKSFEPFIGFYGGGSIGQFSVSGGPSGGGSLGNVWGYWFSPALGMRYFIPNSHWFIGAEALFVFLGDMNGFNKGPAVNANVNVSGSSYLYEPIVMMTIGYAF
ncbi:outer membrane beta-barrel protein [Verrucomicrobium sp. 3C]|uniref:outer membrane beta-barrel protein n=1 Tax=Verrucomicrobium sp. 3C TaxID=1134055 RepID=UPI0003AA13B5|nr:outer membrane beta-barrel protein [Verrucomicrobium sp. 3C]